MIHLSLGTRLWALRLLLASALLAWLLPAAAEPAPADSAGPAPSASAKASGASEEEDPELAEQTPEEALQAGAGLVNRAHAALSSLEKIRERARVGPELVKLKDEVLERHDALREQVQEATTNVRRSRRAFWIRDIRFSFLEDLDRLEEWEEQVAEESERLTAGKKQTQKLLEFWQRAQELARKTKVPAAIREQADRVVEAARATEKDLAGPLATIIPLQSTLTETKELVESFLEAASKEGPNLLRDAHVHDFTIRTAVEGLSELSTLRAATSAALAHARDMGRRFSIDARDELAAQGLFTLLSVFVLFRLRVRARAWPEDEREGRVARRIVGHPLASALQVGTVVGLGLYDEKPTVVAIAVYLVAVSSAAVVFVGLLLPRQRRLLGIAVVLLCADLVRILLGELAYLERVLLIGELAIFALLLAYLLRRPDWKDLGLSERATASLRFVVWVWIWGSGVGAVAGAAGYGHVAEIAGAGMLRSMFLALAYAGLLEASTSVLWIVLQTEPAKKINFVREHRTLVVQRLSTLFTWIAVALWAKGTLSYLTLLDTFVNASKELLKTALEVGALKISVGDVLALVFGTVLAVYVARLLRFVLDQDLLGRITMSEGTRQVAGSSIYWAALLFGLFASVAAAGIGLENLTVLAGALGVGVGFGLQNVVQNFVGGLILLFGGFIKVGHQIQLAELMGEVRTIGFWASTVRTLQGAEVIVPNALLISDKVINWTLSDPKRRVELDIGIEYGTDPDRILAILLEVARSNEKVLVEPPPEALFVKHGESSLDFQLRAWVTFNDFEPISSELTVALNKRLVEERIGIPFPQCDMNILSISPEAATTLLNTRGTPST